VIYNFILYNICTVNLFSIGFNAAQTLSMEKGLKFKHEFNIIPDCVLRFIIKAT